MPRENVVLETVQHLIVGTVIINMLFLLSIINGLCLGLC